MFTLPLDRRTVSVRPPAGVDEVYLLEAAGNETEVALGLLSRLVNTGGLETLAVTDFEALLLELRRLVFGDRVQCDLPCPHACGARIDVEFSIAEYLEHARPQPVRGVIAEEGGWYRAGGRRFRVPTAADQMAAAYSCQPEAELLQRCAGEADLPARAVRRIEAALEKMAPTLSQMLEGECPNCGLRAEMFFDVQRFVLTELRRQAEFLYDDVDRIAARYHWPEESILAMPASRRMKYAERCS